MLKLNREWLSILFAMLRSTRPRLKHPIILNPSASDSVLVSFGVVPRHQIRRAKGNVSGVYASESTPRHTLPVRSSLQPIGEMQSHLVFTSRLRERVRSTRISA